MTISEPLVFKFHSYILFLNKAKKTVITVRNNNSDAGFESPCPESLSLPPGFDAPFTHNTFIHT